MHRYFRLHFSIKALLFGVFLLSIAFASFSLRAEKARRQATAVSKLQSLGATIYYDFQLYYEDELPDDDAWCLDPNRKPKKSL